MASTFIRRACDIRSPAVEYSGRPLSKVSELGHEFEYHFEPSPWFDARQGYKRFAGGAANAVGDPVGFAHLWRSRSGDVVARMTSPGHRIAFKVVKECGEPVLDDEIDVVNDDLMNLLELWIFQGADDWPEI
jgi:hypothetical protein